jgi:hypothetical protein
MHETYMKPAAPLADTFIDVPDTEAWIHAYLHRGWELIHLDGKPMLKYPSDMGMPLHPNSPEPFWSTESPPPLTGKRKVRKPRR